LDVDLVEIAAAANPPVCRLMDYGKFKYHEQKKAAEAKASKPSSRSKRSNFVRVRMMVTTTSRCETSALLADGDKCKITLRFRGREITHQEIGLALLQRIRDELADLIVVEQFPKLEGRQMIMMIAPGARSRVPMWSSRGRHRSLRPDV
jgi:translation initiation factor IF-3